MRRFFVTALFAVFSLGAIFAQMDQPLSWKFSSKDLGDGKVEVICEVTLEDGWHIYSSDLPENTAFPTLISFEESDKVIPVGGIIEDPAPKEHFDEAFKTDLKWFEKKGVFKHVVEVKGAQQIKGMIEYMICNDEQCMPPTEQEFEIQLGATTASAAIEEVKEEQAVSDETTRAEGSYWGLFWIAFGAGLLALLTPCVFPMIPMTVSFFTKQSPTKAAGIRNAILYGLSIIFIYVVLGTSVSVIFGAEKLNAMSTNPWFNIFFFVLLVVFAISFFGAFELVLPSSWVNFADRKSDKGGFIGIFFMAFTLALVSFSCTGPIVGGLMFEAASGGFLGPIVGMFGFSLAIALPFALFAAFPGYLNSLPKSGGWLNSVKVVLGFLELAFAFKFLSMADMVMDWHLLEREVYFAIWVAIFGALSLYLLGKIRLPHDSPMEYIPVSRFMLGLLTLSFTIYMIPGLWGAPVKLISGFPPPKDYAESPLGVGREIPASAFVSAGAGESVNHSGLPEGMHPGPQNIPAFKDYDKALAYAKKVNKPLLLDFTGKACANCRKVEDNVWSDQSIQDILTNDYILVSLYVDLRTKLPEDEVYYSEVLGKKVKYVGQKWQEFQQERYNQAAQPYYVLVDPDEKQLNEPKAYEPDITRYKNWLMDGLEKFGKE
jgi:thiol:disulfide interchange protein DsbD